MTRLAAASLFFALSGFFAAGAPSTTPTPAVRAKVHGVAVSGRVVNVDGVKKTFSVREASGKEVALSWTGATKIVGGDLKAGDAVTLRYLDKDKRHIAAYIRVNAGRAGASATPTSAPAAAPSATPGR